MFVKFDIVDSFESIANNFRGTTLSFIIVIEFDCYKFVPWHIIPDSLYDHSECYNKNRPTYMMRQENFLGGKRLGLYYTSPSHA